MRSNELKRAKRAIRREVLALRDAMPPEDREREGRRAVDRLLALERLRGASTVAAFWSFGSEVPTAPLIHALADRGVRVALPKIEGTDLELRAWVPGDPVEPTSFGAMEPVDGEHVAPADVDVVCTPGVAFDPEGRRVGYGGGYYDRLFDRVNPAALRIAIAFELQVVDGTLPQGPFDRRVHVVVTPTRTLVADSDR